LELGRKPGAVERARVRAVYVDRRLRVLARTRERDPDVRGAALAGSVDDAAHDGDEQVLDAREVAAPLGHPAGEHAFDPLCELLERRARRAPTAGARGHGRHEGAEAERLEDLLAHAHFERAIA